MGGSRGGESRGLADRRKGRARDQEVNVDDACALVPCCVAKRITEENGER